VSSPDLAAEVTIEPVEKLGVDAAILFSDILVIPECMGLDYEMVESVGPRFPVTIQSQENIDNLLSGDDAAGKLGYVYDAIAETLTRLEGRVPLIGFAGAPWTLLSYMIEGSGSKTFWKAKRFLYQHPASAHDLLEKLTDTIIAYLQAKIKAGVHVVQLFDSWAGILNYQLYTEFGLPYLNKITTSLQQVPVIIFARGAWFALHQLNTLPCAALGIDWQTQPAYVRSICGKNRVLQGNLDPVCLMGDHDTIRERSLDAINEFGPPHIMNLGHGVYPDTPLENVKYFVELIKSYRYE